MWRTHLGDWHSGELSGVLTCMQVATLIVKFMVTTWGPSGADRTQVGPMLAPWTLLSGNTRIATMNGTNNSHGNPFKHIFAGPPSLSTNTKKRKGEIREMAVMVNHVEPSHRSIGKLSIWFQNVSVPNTFYVLFVKWKIAISVIIIFLGRFGSRPWWPNTHFHFLSPGWLDFLKIHIVARFLSEF